MPQDTISELADKLRRPGRAAWGMSLARSEPRSKSHPRALSVATTRKRSQIGSAPRNHALSTRFMNSTKMPIASRYHARQGLARRNGATSLNVFSMTTKRTTKPMIPISAVTSK